MIPRVKVCCIASLEEAWLAIRHGASALGLVSAMPSGPGVIDEDRIREVAVSTPPGISRFLLTSETDPLAIIDQQRRCEVDTLQLVDRLEYSALELLRAALPGISLVQVIHVRGPASSAEAREIAPWVDALLLDSGDPEAIVKELGGTGRTHDWEVSRAIVETVEVPVYLAGGLTPTNVAGAIDAVRPFGLDLCSGIRTDGRLDAEKLEAFMTAVWAAEEG